jgi:hypothetical protein
MFRVLGLVAAAVFAAVASCMELSAGELDEALAQDWFWSFPGTPRNRGEGTSDSREAHEKNRERIRLLVFSGVDLWRNGVFAHDGLHWAPSGTDRDGFVFKVIASSGHYRYRAGSLNNAEVTGWMNGAAVMPGAHFTRGGLSVNIYMGADLQAHELSPFDPGSNLQGRHIGLRFAADLWTEPSPQTMLAVSGTMSSIGASYAGRIAFGWRALDGFYVGPEAITYGTPDYRQYRLGIHLTALRVRLFHWRFECQGGAGYAVDDDGNTGPYARFGILWRH